MSGSVAVPRVERVAERATQQQERQRGRDQQEPRNHRNPPAGEELGEYVSATFVKTTRAKGAGIWRVGRHIFRNAAIPLLTVFFGDMLGMVVLGVFVVEYVTHVPGIGELVIDAVLNQKLPLLLSVSLLSVMAGLAANFAQDVAYALFDPRVEFEE